MDEDVYQLSVIFRGHVQGVYFRATTEHIARSFAVTGRVWNLPDGRVSMVAEGTEPEVEAFLSRIQEVRSDHITDVERESSMGPRQYEDFAIAH